MLIFNDNNRIIAEHAQPIGGAVLARKMLRLKNIVKDRPVDLFVLANPLLARPEPLSVHFNGRRIAKHHGRRSDAIIFRWYGISVPEQLIRPGPNEMLFSCRRTPGPPAWELALAATPHPTPDSVSRNGGKTWTHTGLGKYAAINGSFVVRLRIDDGKPTPQPAFIHERSGQEELRRVRSALPSAITDRRGTTFDRARRLSTWLCSKLIYCNSGPRYCPWNFWQILHANDENRWALRAGKSLPHTVMCVHFAVAFVQAALALGWKARCIVSMADMHTMAGHFFPEVWLNELDRWAVVDPTGDFCFLDETGAPRSAIDLYPSCRQLPQWIRFGPGWNHNASRLRTFIKTCVRTGATYRNIAYWRRNDFFSHPDQTPPSHGSIIYCEPDLVWLSGDDPYIRAFPYDCRRHPPSKGCRRSV